MRRTSAFVMAGACVYLAGCVFLSSESEAEDFAPVDSIILVDTLDMDAWAWEPATIEGASIDGLTLELMVTYRGGCGDHRFHLLSPPNLAQSLPPQHSLFLTHDAGGDTCGEKQHRRLRFDLSPLKHRYSLPLFMLRLEEPGATESYESLLPVRF